MNLKRKTARTLKWSMVDRVATQVLYALTGIVLARQLSTEDFGLVGAILIFQAFASLIVDSGFSRALVQRKTNTRLGYSTVLWFNLGAAVVLYAVLFVCAPLVAACFQHDARLIPLSRVMFLSLIINASAIVQINRLNKAMDVRLVALANSLGLVVGGVVGIALALTGCGAWAIVWQTLVIGIVKSVVLWVSTRWRPLWRFSWSVLRSYFGIGSRMMFSSFLNVVFQNIYSFIIGNQVGLSSLGYYSQSDKWSKMGVASISQVLTSSFLPTLSAVQDQPERYRRLMSKMNRFTAYLLFPATLGLAAMATPIFHALFGTKWDPSIFLFQLLLVRGVFTVLNALYTNYLLGVGQSNAIVKIEIVQDTAALLALAITFPLMGETRPDDPVYGLRLMLYGQLAASMLTWAVSLVMTVRLTGVGVWSFCRDMAPYLAETLLIIPLMLIVGAHCSNAWQALAAEALVAVGVYVGLNAVFGSQIQREVLQRR